MNPNSEGFVALDRLRDHYRHCIRLSASNKINPKNAFDLQLIDYMQDLVSTSEDGQMNFKIASSALDVGAKIYSNRVDCIQSEAQKVASSILMALDGQKADNGRHGDNRDDTQGGDDNDTSMNSANDSRVENDAQSKNSRKKTRRNVKTVVEDETLLDAKLEKMVLGDPFLDGLSQDYDMSCPAALICYNALTQPNCLLTVESNNYRKNYSDTAERVQPGSYTNVTLISKNTNCAQIIRSNQTNSICPRLNNFLFNDRSTKISGFNSSLDNSSDPISQMNTSSSKLPTGGAHEFDPELYDDAGNDNLSDGADSVRGADCQDENDLIPNLDRIAASKPSEYGYSNDHHRLLNTWAGPYAWKVAKAPGTAPTGLLRSTRKRVKIEQMPIDWSEDKPQIDEEIVEKSIRHSAQVIRRWTKKPFRPQDHNYCEETTKKVMEHTFLRPEDTYHCVKTAADARKSVEGDHDYANRHEKSDSISPELGGFDNVHDDSDDEFRADPIVDGNEVAVFGAALNTSLTQAADMEFAGENLIEQPFTVAQMVIPFAKIAKKMDVRKLKHVMWDLLKPLEKQLEESNQENNITVIENQQASSSGDQLTVVETPKKTPSPVPTESDVHLEFSSLYGELPVRVSSKMASDLSQPIAFVTLLHLANEKNLKLISKDDLRDFTIEQDNLVQ